MGIKQHSIVGVMLTDWLRSDWLETDINAQLFAIAKSEAYRLASIGLVGNCSYLEKVFR